VRSVTQPRDPHKDRDSNKRSPVGVADVAVGDTSTSTRWRWLPKFLPSDIMSPDRALQEQIERYRRMTGEQRLRIALELHELSCNVAREGIRQQHPTADEAEVERLLRRRLELARQ